jgi:hypothetical protein
MTGAGGCIQCYCCSRQSMHNAVCAQCKRGEKEVWLGQGLYLYARYHTAISAMHYAPALRPAPPAALHSLAARDEHSMLGGPNRYAKIICVKLKNKNERTSPGSRFNGVHGQQVTYDLPPRQPPCCDPAH